MRIENGLRWENILATVNIEFAVNIYPTNLNMNEVVFSNDLAYLVCNGYHFLPCSEYL